MSNYRLYRDGENNFTLQAPDNSTVAIFSVEEISPGSYQVNHLDLSKSGSPKRSTLFRKRLSRELTIGLARNKARELAFELDPDFQDLTEREFEYTNSQNSPKDWLATPPEQGPLPRLSNNKLTQGPSEEDLAAHPEYSYMRSSLK